MEDVAEFRARFGPVEALPAIGDKTAALIQGDIPDLLQDEYSVGILKAAEVAALESIVGVGDRDQVTVVGEEVVVVGEPHLLEQLQGTSLCVLLRDRSFGHCESKGVEGDGQWRRDILE